MNFLVYIETRVRRAIYALYLWELRVRVNLAHFILSAGENYPLALVTYDQHGEIDTITYGKNRATLNFISKKLKQNQKLKTK